jgi:Uncharacterized protein conserved in bacteria
LGGVITGDAR